MPAQDHSKAQTLKSLDVALRVLEAFTVEQPDRGVTELADRLDVSKASIYRVLATLERRNFVVQDATSGRYRVGSSLRRMGNSSLAKLDLPIEARPFMESLRDEIGEEVHLATLDGDEAVYISKVGGIHPVQVVSSIGDRSPAHCVSTGKMLLAYAEQGFLDRLLGQGLVCHTERTHATRSSLMRELEQVRKQGYAVNSGEWRDDVRGVAAPVLDGAGQIAAAMGICGPAYRLTEERIEASTPSVKDGAGKLSAYLGYPGTPLPDEKPMVGSPKTGTRPTSNGRGT